MSVGSGSVDPEHPPRQRNDSDAEYRTHELLATSHSQTRPERAAECEAEAESTPVSPCALGRFSVNPSALSTARRHSSVSGLVTMSIASTITS